MESENVDDVGDVTVVLLLGDGIVEVDEGGMDEEGMEIVELEGGLEDSVEDGEFEFEEDGGDCEGCEVGDELGGFKVGCDVGG